MQVSATPTIDRFGATVRRTDLGRTRNGAHLPMSYFKLPQFDQFYYLADRVFQRLSRGRCRFIRYLFVAQPIPSSPSSDIKASAKVEIRPIRRHDAVTANFPRAATIINARFDNGHSCLGAFNAGEWAGFLWYTRGHYDEDELRCRYRLGAPEICVWDYDVHVEPRYRMGRMFARLWEGANERLRNDGIRWSFSRISASNPHSLRSHARLGIRIVASGTFVRLGPIQISMFSKKPFLHIGWRNTQIPHIVLLPPLDADT